MMEEISTKERVADVSNDENPMKCVAESKIEG